MGRRTATELGKLTEGWRGDARWYILSEPISYTSRDAYGDEVPHTTNYVIVSALATSEGGQTYIFPANDNGEELDMKELPGSYVGGLDHRRALWNAGFILVGGKEPFKRKNENRQIR